MQSVAVWLIESAFGKSRIDGGKGRYGLKSTSETCFGVKPSAARPRCLTLTIIWLQMSGSDSALRCRCRSVKAVRHSTQSDVAVLA